MVAMGNRLWVWLGCWVCVELPLFEATLPPIESIVLPLALGVEPVLLLPLFIPAVEPLPPRRYRILRRLLVLRRALGAPLRPVLQAIRLSVLSYKAGEERARVHQMGTGYGRVTRRP